MHCKGLPFCCQSGYASFHTDITKNKSKKRECFWLCTLNNVNDVSTIRGSTCSTFSNSTRTNFIWAELRLTKKINIENICPRVYFFVKNRKWMYSIGNVRGITYTQKYATQRLSIIELLTYRIKMLLLLLHLAIKYNILERLHCLTKIFFEVF